VIGQTKNPALRKMTMAQNEFDSEMAIIIVQLSAAVQNTGMYPNTHPNILSRIREAYDLLAALLKKKKEINVFCIGENLLVDNKPLNVAGTSGAAFIRVLKRNKINRLTFLNGLSFTMLETLIHDLASSNATAIRSSSHIKLGRLDLEKRTAMEGAIRDEGSENILEIFEHETEPPSSYLRNLYQNIIDTNMIDFDMLDKTVLQLINNLHTDKDMWQLLSQVKTNDEYTFIHTANVGIVTMYLAEHLGFKSPMIQEIGVAAVLHDVGKLMIPDDIISKQAPLSAEERMLMETHPLKGALYLMNMKSTRALPTLVALEHHIKYDGGGYPKVRKGYELNIISQIVTIADVFDALRTLRPYRDPVPMTKVIEMMRNESGCSFNPFLIEQFLNLIREAPHPQSGAS
jgi:HD-GYP domain-containing protein (c-di-GMP phosphodiesterase class II)